MNQSLNAHMNNKRKMKKKKKSPGPKGATYGKPVYHSVNQLKFA
jgi:hypothetical protein